MKWTDFIVSDAKKRETVFRCMQKLIISAIGKPTKLSGMVMSVLIKRLFCIVYLSLCEEMSDREIGKKVRISRPKVQRIKQKIKRQYITL